MSSEPGIDCQAETITIDTHARFGLARMLSCSGAKPTAVAAAGSEFEKRKLNT
jgi:hypothetical protein